MDQLVTPDGNYLLPWKEVKLNNDNKYKGKTPKWYKNLENNFVISNLLTLSIPLKEPTSIPDRIYPHPAIKNNITRPSNQWTLHWNTSINECTFGKTIYQESNNNFSITYSTHYIPLPSDSHNNNNNNISSRELLLTLIPCNGCHLNSYLPSPDIRPLCVFSNRTKRLTLFTVHTRSSFEYKSRLRDLSNNPFVKKNFFLTVKPFLALRNLAY
jgi:hypothetical protein